MPRHALTVLLLLSATLCSCDRYSARRAVAEAEQCIEKQPDSAYAILMRTAETDLDDEGLAHYRLLFSQAKYKMERHTSTDGLTRAIGYYRRHPQPALLQRALYYRGAIGEDNGVAAATVLRDYKEAESHIHAAGDTLMAIRIYEGISGIHLDSWDTDEALSYMRKEMQLIRLSHNRDFLIPCLNNMLIAFRQDEQWDSVSTCMQEILRLSRHADHAAKSTIYTNIANFYADDQRQYATAIRYYKAALRHKEQENTRAALAESYLHMGKTTEMEHILAGLSHTRDTSILILVANLRCLYYARVGDYRNAYRQHLLSDSLTEQLQFLEHNEIIRETERRYDALAIKETKDGEVTDLIITILTVIVIFLTMTILLLYKIRRKKAFIRSLTLQLQELDRRAATLRDDNEKNIREKFREFDAITREKQMIIDHLTRQADRKSEENLSIRKSIQDLSEGTRTMYYVLQDETGMPSGKTERMLFIDCFRILDKEFVERIEALHDPTLTTTERLFCILVRMDKEKDKIMTILSLSPDSYRQIKSRTLKKLRTAGFSPRFCDKMSAL